jgi:hypothetical protein
MASCEITDVHDVDSSPRYNQKIRLWAPVFGDLANVLSPAKACGEVSRQGLVELDLNRCLAFLA